MADSSILNVKQPDGTFLSGAASAMPANAMPADSLGKNPSVYSTYFPQPAASTGLAESAVASKDAYLANLAKEADTISADTTAKTTAAKTLFDRLGLSATAKADAYDSSGLNNDKRAIDEITTQMETRGRAYDKQVADLTANNPEGKLKSGLDIQINDLNRQKASELADLAIVLNAKTRNYDTAKSIIDTKADAETEDLKTNLQGLQFFLQQNQSTLSKDESALLQDKIKQADQELSDAKATRTIVGNVQLEAAKNKAPIDVIRAIGKATNEEEAIAAAGSFLQSQTSSSDVFTKTQLNGGASNAGLSISGFDQLTPDDQNYFINGYSGFTSAQKQVQDGNATLDDLKSAIDEAPISPKAKQILYTKAGIDPNAKAPTGGFFSDAWSLVKSLF